MRGRSWFPHGGATKGCSSTAVGGGSWQPKLGDIWIDPRRKITSRVSWAERLVGPDTILDIKQTAKIDWFRKERFLV
jgi:hypothetical protein